MWDVPFHCELYAIQMKQCCIFVMPTVELINTLLVLMK